ncbi:MAG: glycosyltransferase family 9 protein [Bacteroidota bacterium]
MKLKSKILIDQIIGLPLVYTLNVLARVLGLLLRIDHSLNKPIKTIAVCKFVGLGSIIQATPLLQTLRKNYPDSSIVFISNESNRALLNHVTEVDKVFTISDRGILALLKSTSGLLFKLWKQKPDIYIDLEIYSNYSSVIATMSLSKNRIGFFKNDKTYRKGIYTHMLYFNVKSPISQTYLQFARLLGCKDIVAELSINTKNIDPTTVKIIDQKLNTILQKYIVVNPNASDLRLERRWDLENFATLIHKICAEFPEHKVILIGAENETEYVARLASQLQAKKNVLNSSGKLSIKELLILIGNASLMITNDTGPMHIAFALKVKTVALFGPCSPQQYGGIENTVTIYKNTYCSPCVHEFLIPPCKGDNQCMKKIKVEEVFKSVHSQLNSTENFTNRQLFIDYTNGDGPLGVVLR